METVDASAVIVGVSLAILLMIIRVQSVLQDVLKAAIELASAKPATAAAETQTGVQVQDIWPGPATHNRVRQRNERAPDARYRTACGTSSARTRRPLPLCWDTTKMAGTRKFRPTSR